MPTNFTLKQKRRRQNLIGDYTERDWLRLCKKYHNRCVKCGRAGQKLTVDHILPLSRGGKDLLSNIQCLCAECNQEKADTIADYRKDFQERYGVRK